MRHLVRDLLCFRRLFLLLSLRIVLAAATAAQSTLNVPGQYATIQQAIAAASHGDTISVSPGTYSGPFNFQSKRLSLVSTNGPATTSLIAPNLSTILTIMGGPSGTRLVDGFMIKNGLGPGFGSLPAGLHVESVDVVVRNCVFSNNVGTYVTVTSIVPEAVGAMSIINATALVENCQFNGNRGTNGIGAPFLGSPTSVYAARGGSGAIRQANSTSTFRECTFSGNVGGNGYAGSIAGGPGAAIVLAGSATFESCTFQSNTGGDGGALDVTSIYQNIGGPGVMRCENATVTLEKCTLTSNSGGVGFSSGGDGAIHSLNCSLSIERSSFLSNFGYGGPFGSGALTESTEGGAGAIDATGSLLIRNSVFRGNVGGTGDSAVSAVASPPGAGAIEIGGTIVIENSTIAGNTAGVANQSQSLRKSGGIFLLGPPTATSLVVVNSILWGNLGQAPPTSTNPYFVQLSHTGGTITTTCIQGLPGVASPYNSDPLFVSPTNLRLQVTSPALNAGTNLVDSATSTDRDGKPRRSYFTVDLGAYEFRSNCLDGAIGVGQGGPFPIFSVNGQTGPEVEVGLNQPIAIAVAQPPNAVGPRPFLVLAVLGIPHPFFETDLGALGCLAFSLDDPTLTFVAVAYLPFPGELVTPTPTPWSYTYLPGLPFPTQLTFQGVANEGNFVDHVFNAVFLDVH